MELVDIITSIFQQHSIASVIQYDRKITKSESYKQLFAYLFEYVKDHIKTNLNTTYQLKKDLIFTDTANFLG